MSYLNCPGCRLTVHNSPPTPPPEKCPRCRAKLGDSVPALFATREKGQTLDVETVMRVRAERRGDSLAS
jgi:hypothetical protein